MPDYKTHMKFHKNPPSWIPRCQCCGRPTPEKIPGRPEGIGLIYNKEDSERVNQKIEAEQREQTIGATAGLI